MRTWRRIFVRRRRSADLQQALFSRNLKSNNLYLDGGLGVAVRIVGGDICQGNRLVQFIGTDSCAIVGPDLKTLLEFNAIRASFSLFLFAQRGVDDPSGLRFLIGLGAAGDFIKVN